MAQTEDTELSDLVIEALEKNGSLAKIRALLRANIFLAFEDECDNVRHNVSLDNVLKVREGICALSIVHEFLEFCNLKNTLFVYKSESRQGKDYKYDGKKLLFDKLNFNKLENGKEPVLITLIKNALMLNYKNHSDNILNKLQECGDNIFKDEPNSSYIVHEDSQSSATSTSQSDNSIDEKNKLHLRLHLDNSDTDTSSSSRSSRGKTASEYIPSEHVIEAPNCNKSPKKSIADLRQHLIQKQELSLPTYFTKVAGNTSSDSTSYVELKPYSFMDEKLLNTSGLPPTDLIDPPEEQIKTHSDHTKSDSIKSAILSSISSLSLKNDKKLVTSKKSSQESAKSDAETAEYSLDFSVSQNSINKENSDQKRSDHLKDFINEGHTSSPTASPHQNSHSSISISDVADLISDESSSSHPQNNEKSLENKSNVASSNSSIKKSLSLHNKLNSDDSGDYSESPIPSLSNLSLDIHSD